MKNTMKKPVAIPVEKLRPFDGHPFKVKNDDEMNALIESIQMQGVLSPLIVRPIENTEEYEVISGHRRLHAAQKAGITEIPALIYALDRDAAAIAVVDSNLHREHILPSEKAFAYRMKLEAMSRQGHRSDLTSDQLGRKLETAEIIAQQSDDSKSQVRRYIRLTYLIPEFLEEMDKGEIALSVGVELSMPEDAERKGLGTPATRAAILEKLVATGFVERKKSKKAVNLLPTHAGISLITVLPEQLQSPLMTAEWEHRLKEIERGEESPETFMQGIRDMVCELVKTYKTVLGADVLFPSGRTVVGKCPRCGSNVTESKKGYFCERNDCHFGLWRDNRFLAAKKINLTKKMAEALLRDGKTYATGIFSEKTGKTYDAYIVLEDDGTKTAYRLEFERGKANGKQYS